MTLFFQGSNGKMREVAKISDMKCYHAMNAQPANLNTF